MLITLLLHVALAVPTASAVSPALVRSAVAEAAGIWAPYGVTIEAAAPCGWATDDRVVLTVVPVARRAPTPAAGWRAALGAITFAPDGEPAPAITVFLTDIERLVAAAHVFGASPWQWPPTLRQQILGRVLGRVLAHEIGHYVLRSPEHAAAGLMRPLQYSDDLVAPSRRLFALTAAEAARLEARR